MNEKIFNVMKEKINWVDVCDASFGFVDKYTKETPTDKPRIPQECHTKEVKVIKSYTIPEPKRVIFNDSATIVIWEDNTKTVVHCDECDFWDEEKGLSMAICKRVFDNKGNYNNILKKLLSEAQRN